MIDFHNFETFDPNGPGLGNLFGQISPLRGARDLALRRLPPRPRRRRRARRRLLPRRRLRPRPARLGRGALLAPPRGRGPRRPRRRRPRLPRRPRRRHRLHRRQGDRDRRPARRPRPSPCPSPPSRGSLVRRGTDKGTTGRGPPSRGSSRTGRSKGTTRWGGGGGRPWRSPSSSPRPGSARCSPSPTPRSGRGSYSPALTGLRPLVANGSTLVLASPSCSPTNTARPTSPGSCAAAGSASPPKANSTSRRAASASSSPKARADEPPFPGLRVRRVAPPYVLWEVTGPVAAHSPCPLIAVRQARQGPAR